MANALTNIEFDIDCRIRSEEDQQRMINAARDQAARQGCKCVITRKRKPRLVHVIIRSDDRGKALAFETAFRLWLLTVPECHS